MPYEKRFVRKSRSPNQSKSQEMRQRCSYPHTAWRFVSTYKRSNVFNHCTAEASLYEHTTADRTMSNPVITPTPANVASARLCQSKSPPSITMLVSEKTTNDEQQLPISSNSASPNPTLPQYKLLLLLP